MRKVHTIVAIVLLSLACASGQTTIISSPLKDPEVKPEQRTATIVHYEKMRLSARRTIRILALALQNTDAGGSTSRLNEALNNEQDIVEWSNWCITALRDRKDEAVACAFPPGLNEAAGLESACQAAENSRLHVNCSQGPASAKRSESGDTPSAPGDDRGRTSSGPPPTS